MESYMEQNCDMVVSSSPPPSKIAVRISHLDFIEPECVISTNKDERVCDVCYFWAFTSATCQLCKKALCIKCFKICGGILCPYCRRESNFKVEEVEQATFKCCQDEIFDQHTYKKHLCQRKYQCQVCKGLVSKSTPASEHWKVCRLAETLTGLENRVEYQYRLVCSLRQEVALKREKFCDLAYDALEHGYLPREFILVRIHTPTNLRENQRYQHNESLELETEIFLKDPALVVRDVNRKPLHTGNIVIWTVDPTNPLFSNVLDCPAQAIHMIANSLVPLMHLQAIPEKRKLETEERKVQVQIKSKYNLAIKRHSLVHSDQWERCVGEYYFGECLNSQCIIKYSCECTFVWPPPKQTQLGVPLARESKFTLCQSCCEELAARTRILKATFYIANNIITRNENPFPNFDIESIEQIISSENQQQEERRQ